MTPHPGGAEAAGVSTYEIVIRGRLSRRYDAAFDGVTLLPRASSTLLRAQVTDPAQLYGLLNRLRDFGIELISVNESDGSS
jgi:hypothetical protein